MPYNPNRKATAPDEELYILQKWNDKQTGETKQKRVVWSTGWSNVNPETRNTEMKFPLGKAGGETIYLYVKKKRPDRKFVQQQGYQGDRQGHQPNHNHYNNQNNNMNDTPPPPSSEEDYHDY
jgi:hypothetical protein